MVPVKATARWVQRHRDVLIVLVVIFGLWGANAAKNEHTEHVQQQQARAIERALCADVGSMAAIQAPAGPAATNPSRAFEQAEHRAWSGLVRDLGCKGKD
jgi:hypothetical protein